MKIALYTLVCGVPVVLLRLLFMQGALTSHLIEILCIRRFS